MQEKTIVAIATATGAGAVGIVRISGPKSLEIARGIFVGKTQNFTPRMLYLGTANAGGVSDQVLMAYFKAPHSFTGEDVVEFQCHGGRVVLLAIVRRAIQLGAVPAGAGEFTKQAFLSGKMNISQIEGMADLISAESEAEAEIAFEVFEGGLYQKVKGVQDALLDVMLFVEASFDYPEEEMPNIGTAENLACVESGIEVLSSLLLSYSYGKKVKEGVKVAILGNPNVGKSSIFNALCGEDRAIVTDIAGTTRDVVEVRFAFRDLLLSFFDTAGIRETSDVVEKIGVERGLALAGHADVLLAIFDERGVDADVLNLCRGKEEKSIVVFNKTDVGYAPDHGGADGFEALEISAKSGAGMESLYEAIYKKASIKKQSGVVLTSERHYSVVKEARDMLCEIKENICNLPADLVAIDMKAVWEKLGEITGTTSSEEIINAIFSRLCLGK